MKISKEKKLLLKVMLVITLLWSYPDLKAAYLYQKTAASMVMLMGPNGRGGGSGFELSYGSRDYTVTNAHVCEIGRKEGYLIAEGRGLIRTKLKILKQSPFTDLCLLEPIQILPKLKMRSHEFAKGDLLSIWGHPGLRPLEVTDGKVLVASHVIDVSTGFIITPEDEKRCHNPKNKIAYIWGIFRVCLESIRSQYVSAGIEPGSSGSAVLDQNGKVGGVAFAAMNRGDGKKSPAEIIPWASLYIFLAQYSGVYVGLD